MAKPRAARDVSRAQLKRYGEAVSLWLRKFDTDEIARELKLLESLVAGWVANFRDCVSGRRAA